MDLAHAQRIGYLQEYMRLAGFYMCHIFYRACKSTLDEMVRLPKKWGLAIVKIM